MVHIQAQMSECYVKEFLKESCQNISYISSMFWIIYQNTYPSLRYFTKTECNSMLDLFFLISLNNAHESLFMYLFCIGFSATSFFLLLLWVCSFRNWRSDFIKIQFSLLVNLVLRCFFLIKVAFLLKNKFNSNSDLFLSRSA